MNLFEFDYDVTMMMFFLDAGERVYARYGGRDGKNADGRQSLQGLRHTMQSVLEMHEREEKEFAPRSSEASRFIRDGSRGFERGCMHCHQVREALNSELRRTGKWERDLAWRYPLPENLGFDLEVDRGNVIRQVRTESSAAAAGLRQGDRVQRLHGVPVHSFADAQFALDIAPKTGSIDIVWQRGDQTSKGVLALPESWRKTDLSWRASMQRWVPWPRLAGPDLADEEKKALGLPIKQLAFRQREPVPTLAQAVGVRAGDVILGLDDQRLEMNADEFFKHVQSSYLAGDRVTINILRDGRRVNLPMTLTPLTGSPPR